MCGIMGYVRTGNSKIRRRELLEELMRGIETRGRHAAGAACLGVNHNVWGRSPGTASQFVKDKWWDRIMDSNPRLLIGHARFATHGSPQQNKNNHPFVSDDGRWMVIHNGIIHDDVAVDVPPRGECDSELILRMLVERGLERTIATMERFTRSSFACMALDTAERRLYAWRNDGNPLVVADLSDQIGGIVLASTEQILRTSIIRARLDLAGVKVYSFRVGYRYHFPANCAAGCLPALPLDEVKGFDLGGQVRKHFFLDDGNPPKDEVTRYYSDENYPLGGDDDSVN
jgi:glutamine phosphoribosylpyrophosphate amidotransferase